MKATKKFLAWASLPSLFVLTAIAAPTPATATGVSDARNSMEAESPTGLGYLGAPVKAKDLLGKKVDAPEQRKIGRVEDLAVDLQTGRIVEVIVSQGGVLSGGGHTFAVPPSHLQFDPASKLLHLDVPQERLNVAPAFEMSQWTEYYQSGRAKESYNYFGDQVPFELARGRDDQPTVSAGLSGLGYVQKASKLVGMAVRNFQDEKIGSVENLVLDLRSGRVIAVIVSSGGFLGIGDALSVLPPSVLKITDDHNRLRLDTTKEALQKAPRFTTGEWPNFSQPGYADGVYRAYGVKPYFSGERDRALEADNTARNVRDRHNQTLTPADQGNGMSDVKISQQIRQAVVATEGLSVNAKNVKIITVHGRVTLRGPVRTAEEKNLIVDAAARVAHPENVDNQLEVAAE